MVRASKLLQQSKLARQCISEEASAQAAFRSALGPRLSAHITPAALVRGRLVVQVPDEIWRSQLASLEWQILRKMEEIIDPGTVTELQFRVLPPDAPARRMPAREVNPVRGGEAIPDPILSRIYLASCKKANA